MDGMQAAPAGQGSASATAGALATLLGLMRERHNGAAPLQQAWLQQQPASQQQQQQQQQKQQQQYALQQQQQEQQQPATAQTAAAWPGAQPAIAAAPAPDAYSSLFISQLMQAAAAQAAGGADGAALPLLPLPAQPAALPPLLGGFGVEAAPATRKIKVTCQDVPGVLHIDDLYVACLCQQCESRVRLGHDRPIFGLSRFERHCGSKAKKWRLSLRVEPGSCPEVPPGDPPMPVGTWLNLRGIVVKGSGDRAGSDSELPGPGLVSKRARFERWDGGGGGSSGGGGGGHEAEAEEPDGWELALLQEPGPDSTITEGFLRSQQRAFAATACGGEGAGQHADIFRLVLALLEGPNQQLFSECYMPWVNDLPAEQLARQHSTLGCYLNLLPAGMEWRAVHRQLLAYLKGTLRRIRARRSAAGEATGGAAAAGEDPTVPAVASPITTPSTAAATGNADMPASTSLPNMPAVAVAAATRSSTPSSSPVSVKGDAGVGMAQSQPKDQQKEAQQQPPADNKPPEAAAATPEPGAA